MSQIVWQFGVDYNLGLVRRDILAYALREYGVLRLQFFEIPNYAFRCRIQSFVWRLPIANWKHGYFGGCRLCDQLEANVPGFAKTSALQADERTDNYRDQALHACNQLNASKAVIALFCQLLYDVLTRVAGYLTNLLVRFQNYLPNNVRQSRQFLSRFRSFRSPFSGL